MKFLTRSSLSLAVLVALSAASAGAWAQTEPPAAPPARQDSPPLKASRISLSDSVRRAQRETGGQVLGAERVQFDGREINRVKVMDDRGRVRYMDDDPQRGHRSGNDDSSKDRSSKDRPSNDEPRRDRGSEDRGRGAQRPESGPRARRDNPPRP